MSVTPEFQKKIDESFAASRKAISRMDTIDTVFSAWWFAFGLWASWQTHTIFAGFPFFIIGWNHFDVMKSRRELNQVKENHFLEFQMAHECIEELADELGKAVGPKIPNDILRKLLERYEDHQKKKRPPPKAGVGGKLLGKLKGMIPHLNPKPSET